MALQANTSAGGIHRLYIANPTDQFQVVCYRLDHDKEGAMRDINRRFQPARQQEIPPRQQRQIGTVMHMMQITEIVDQLSRYGLIGVKDVDRIGRQFHPYIFDIDRPVSSEAMRRVRENNQGILADKGKALRRRAAVEVNETVQKTVTARLNDMGIDVEPADRTDVSFEQDVQTEMGERRIEEGFHVTPDPKQAARSGAGKTAKGRRK